MFFINKVKLLVCFFFKKDNIYSRIYLDEAIEVVMTSANGLNIVKTKQKKIVFGQLNHNLITYLSIFVIYIK